MNKISITKGKLLKGDVVQISYSEQRVNSQKLSKHEVELKDTPHPDLRKAFDNLTVHAALLGEFVSEARVKSLSDFDIDLIKGYNCSGFSLSGDNDQVVLTGQKTLKSGKAMGFNTPVLRFEDDDSYRFMDELVEAIETCSNELHLYLSGEKLGTPQQGEIEFSELKDQKEEPIQF